MAKKALADAVKKRFEIAEQAQRTLFTNFRHWEDIYNTTFSSDIQLFTGAKVFVPTAWAAVETLVPRMLNRNPVVNYIPVGEEDTKKARKASELFSYWYNKSEAFYVLAQMVKAGLIYGTSFGKLTWKFETVKKRVRDKDGKVREKLVVSYDDPYLEYVDIYDIFIDPKATSLDNARWIIHRIYTSLAELKRQQEDIERKIEILQDAGMDDVAETLVPYENLRLLETRVSESADRPRQEQARKQSLGIDITAKDDTVKEIKLLEMWDKERKMVVLYAPDYDLVLREYPFPYWHNDYPFIVFRDSIVPGEFWGRGEIQPIEKIQHVINTVTNQRIDNINLVLNLMWKAKPTVDDEELVPMPGQIVHVNDLSDVEPIQFPNVTSRAFEELGFWRQQIQEILGITDYIRGMQTPTDETLGEVQIKTMQANFRFQHKIQLFEMLTLKRLGYLVLSLYQQYLTEEKEIRLFGEGGVAYSRVSPEDIMGEYDVVPEAGSTAPDINSVTKEELVNFYMLVKDDPLWDKKEIAKRIAERFGFRNPETVLNEPQEEVALPEGEGRAPAPVRSKEEQAGGGLPPVPAPPPVEGQTVSSLINPEDLLNQ